MYKENLHDATMSILAAEDDFNDMYGEVNTLRNENKVLREKLEHIEKLSLSMYSSIVDVPQLEYTVRGIVNTCKM